MKRRGCSTLNSDLNWNHWCFQWFRKNITKRSKMMILKQFVSPKAPRDLITATSPANMLLLDRCFSMPSNRDSRFAWIVDEFRCDCTGIGLNSSEISILKQFVSPKAPRDLGNTTSPANILLLGRCFSMPSNGNSRFSFIVHENWYRLHAILRKSISSFSDGQEFPWKADMGESILIDRSFSRNQSRCFKSDYR